MTEDRKARVNKLPFDLRTLDEKQLRDFIEVVVNAVQENFDVISGNQLGQAKAFNRLGRDVVAIFDHLGVETDAAGRVLHIQGAPLAGDHDELEGVSANDHHNQSHNQTDHDAAEAGDLSSIDIGDSASAGSSSEVPNADHQHAYPAPSASYPVDVAATEADGSATTPARSDHRHAHGTGYAGAHSDAVNDGDAAGGDLSGTYPNPSVVDSSHDHDATTAPGDAHTALRAVDFLVGTATSELSGEIAVGTTPGGELGGTWASPTVDATHSGSTHSAATDTHIADTSDAHDASAISVLDNGGFFADADVEGALEEIAVGVYDHDHSGSGWAGNADLVPDSVLTENLFAATQQLGWIDDTLAGTEDDYLPTGLFTLGNAIRVDCGGAARTITGVDNGIQGRLLVIHNNSTPGTGEVLTLAHDDAGSAAANRFYFATESDLALDEQAAAIFIWDDVFEYWKMIGGSSGGGGTAGVDIQSVVGTSTNTSGTWTKPSGATWVEVICIGGGGGGGSGKKRATLNARGGGGGGGGGNYANARFYASELNAEEDMQGGRYGSGGAAVSTNNTNGNPGSNGGDSFFGDAGTMTTSTRMVIAAGGTFGAGGTNSGGAGGNAGSLVNDVGGDEVAVGTAGGGGSAGASAGTAGTSFVAAGRGGAGGGGGGGGISGADANSNGGQGGERNQHSSGAGGSGSDGAVGGNGKSLKAVSPDDASASPGTGGGGGRGRVTGAAGDGSGGDGGYYGGGGGGGGAGTDSVADSGAGGDGGPGICLVVTFCD